MEQLTSKKLIEVAENIDRGVNGLRTGHKKIDEMTLGLQSSELIIIAGRPSFGKTSLICDWLLETSKHVPSVLFSIEMGGRPVIERLLCNVAKVSLHDVKKGTSVYKQQVLEAAKELAKRNIYWDDSAMLSPGRLKALLGDVKPGIIFVDYLQLMRLADGQGNRVEEVDMICQGLKAIAKQYQIPVVAASQLRRAPPDARADREPRLEDLRSSGGIEQVADVVLMLHRPAASQQKDNNLEYDDKTGEAEIIIAKQRNGPCGKIPMVYIQEHMSWKDVPEEGLV